MIYARPRLMRAIPACATILCVLLFLCGCEAFARKFTRKQKKEDKPQEIMVLNPQAYPDAKADKEDEYRQYFMFWKSWHEELIDNLSDESPSMRRQLDSVKEAINNLSEMQKLLSGDKRALAGGYLDSMNSLKADIAKDLYYSNAWSLRRQAEDLKNKIGRELQYKQVEDELK